MSIPEQMELLFTGTPVFAAGCHIKTERCKYSSPERQRPLLVGKMILAYGLGPKDKTCGQCVNFDKSRGCSAFSEIHPPIKTWLPSWSACGAFDITHGDDLRHLRTMIADLNRRQHR